MAIPELSQPSVGAGLCIVSALFGASAIVIGAAASHGGMGASSLVEIGLSYHLPHAAVAWAASVAAPLAASRAHGAAVRLRWAALCWLLGILGFSGGLYLHAFAGLRVGVVVPLGAFAMILGWGFAAWAGVILAREAGR